MDKKTKLITKYFSKIQHIKIDYTIPPSEAKEFLYHCFDQALSFITDTEKDIASYYLSIYEEFAKDYTFHPIIIKNNASYTKYFSESLPTFQEVFFGDSDQPTLNHQILHAYAVLNSVSQEELSQDDIANNLCEKYSLNQLQKFAKNHQPQVDQLKKTQSLGDLENIAHSMYKNFTKVENKIFRVHYSFNQPISKLLKEVLKASAEEIYDMKKTYTRDSITDFEIQTRLSRYNLDYGGQ